MDVDNDISTVLAQLRLETENPDIIQIIYQLEDFYERKLWNQLTLAVDELYSIPESREGQLRPRIFSLFLAQFHSKLNPIKVIDFLLESFQNTQDCYDRLVGLKETLTKELEKTHGTRKPDNLDEIIANEECIVYVNLQIARYALLLNELGKADEILDVVGPKFENLLQNEFSSKINAAFYLMKCEYYKLHENYNLFYTNGLLYLSSIETPLFPENQVKFCYDLCIAALLGDKIFNFGELILHDILRSISAEDSPYFWLYSLLTHLNLGNLAKFNEWARVAFEKSPLLANHSSFLQQKIAIMALLELVSVQLTTSKRLLFEQISGATGVPVDDIEVLIIKCLSLGLIKGHINQLEHTLVVTWLQPRILNLDQVKNLYNHLVQWNGNVEALAKQVHTDGGSLWASA